MVRPDAAPTLAPAVARLMKKGSPRPRRLLRGLPSPATLTG